MNSRKGLMDKVQDDCFASSLNLSALKDRSTSAQTWNAPQLPHAHRIPNVNASAITMDSALDIKVHTEQSIGCAPDAESMAMATRDVEAKGAERAYFG